MLQAPLTRQLHGKREGEGSNITAEGDITPYCTTRIKLLPQQSRPSWGFKTNNDNYNQSPSQVQPLPQ